MMNNEIDLLELRLNELDGLVDKHVLVESRFTHQNNPKPLWFLENKHKFQPFLHKILHVVVNAFPEELTNAQHRDYYQRDQQSVPLGQCQDDDVLLINDMDEIPRANVVKAFCESDSNIWSLGFAHYAYYLNCLCPPMPEDGCMKLCRYRAVKEMNSVQLVRMEDKSPLIDNGAWHFSCMGGAERVTQKIQAFCHEEMNTPSFLANIPDRVQRMVDLFDERPFAIVPIDESFPKYLQTHQEKFAHLIRS